MSSSQLDSKAEIDSGTSLEPRTNLNYAQGMAEARPQAAALASVEIHLLGPVRILRGGAITLRGARPTGFLAALALSPGELVSIDEIVGYVWGDRSPNDARHGVHALASTLRAAIGGDLIESRRGGYRLAVEAPMVDAFRFRELVAESEVATPFEALRALKAAVRLFRGQPLAGTPETPALQAVAAGLEEERIGALERRFEVELSLGSAGEVVGELTQLVGAHPLRERLRGQLMTALYQTGRQAEALNLYRDGRRILADELGIEPSRELRELHMAILRQDSRLAPRPKLELVNADVNDRNDAVDNYGAVALVESWAYSLLERDDDALAALDSAHTQVVATLESALRSGQRETALRLVGGMWLYWIIRGEHERASIWSQAALDLPGEASALVEYHGVVGASEIARVRGEYERAEQLKERALRLVGEADCENHRGALLADLAHIWTRLGDTETAEAFALEAIETRRQSQVPGWGRAHALVALGEVREHQGRYDEAIDLYEDAIRSYDEYGYDGEIAFIRGHLLGRTLRAAGDADRASATYRLALTGGSRSRDRGTVATSVQGLAWVALARGDTAAAARLLGSVSGDEYQAPLEPHERNMFAMDVTEVRERIPAAEFEASWQIGLASPPAIRG